MTLQPGHFVVEEGGVSAPPPYQRHPREIEREAITATDGPLGLLAPNHTQPPETGQ